MAQKPKIIRDMVVYAVYFESLYDLSELRTSKEKANKTSITSCKVIAKNAEEALSKAKQAFPAEVVNSIHSERGYDRPHRDLVVL